MLIDLLDLLYKIWWHQKIVVKLGVVAFGVQIVIDIGYRNGVGRKFLEEAQLRLDPFV